MKKHLLIPVQRRREIMCEWQNWGKGFHYDKAIKELLDVGWTEREIADCMGYKSNSTVHRMWTGDQKSEPGHRAGEALYILYVLTFSDKKKKPL
jgi:hypothetical protein